MEYQNIINSLDNASNQPSKFMINQEEYIIPTVKLDSKL